MIIKILLADVPEITDVLRRMLSIINPAYRISVANSIEETKGTIATTSFDLIFIDPYCKTELSRYEILHLEELRQLFALLNSSIVLVDISSQGCPEDIQKHFTYRLPKPFQVEQFRDFMIDLGNRM